MHNYRRKTEVQHCAIHAPDGAPSWVHDRAQLWNTVESGETRVNSPPMRSWDSRGNLILPNSRGAYVGNLVSAESI